MGRIKIIAFDLSLSNSGYAVGEVKDRQLKIVEYGSIGTKRYSKHPTGYRLNYIAKQVQKIYKKYPEAKHVVKERSFSNGRITATQQIYKVVGVWELISHIAKHDDFKELTPASVKKFVTGKGRATKEEVATAVKERTGIETAVDDESDAIAILIALCMQEDMID